MIWLVSLINYFWIWVDTPSPPLKNVKQEAESFQDSFSKDAIPIMIYRPLLGSLNIRGPPESPEQGSCATQIRGDIKKKNQNILFCLALLEENLAFKVQLSIQNCQVIHLTNSILLSDYSAKHMFVLVLLGRHL